MNRCPACGHETQPGANFCSKCGVVLGERGSTPREERKVVTVLFADLVGFTSRSDRMDPEDVRALLSPYYARLRTELERFGGTVEKFIGDAVMALFGAPVAHEDDPERAVRAALAIRDWVLEEQADLQVRIAVNTGEALVALGARPLQGEGMASGDVVNTTARLQTAAPVNGILVGETTYRATSQVITYRAAEPVTAKGKAEPVSAWEAVEARSRLGIDLTLTGRVPLVGRSHELQVLKDALARAQRERAAQLVTLVGVPGIGKSRLVGELFQAVDEDPTELIHWRQGRSLPYGDGVTFWALSEMVKAQAGILETDAPDEAEAKLAASVAALIPDPADAQWIEGHLRPLAGLSTGDASAGDRREETFAAWRRFFEGLAEQGPLMLVFEDLHWADENLLDFVEHLVEWAGGVPVLVVCTTRPELFERRAGWGGGMRNSTTLWLSPLSEDETTRLISSLSGRPVMDAETQQALLDRAGGNPLYAEQYVRMLEERRDAGELSLPETVQGIIAARLDALPTEEKRLLQGAAVIGKVFWLGAVTAVKGADRRDTELRLHALERKDFVQRARRSSVADEAEYAFLHVLVRDVAYGQIPRADRAEQHRLAAEWIASRGRAEDHAELLAHHYLNAIDLRRAAGKPIDARFAESALAGLREAGDRAFSLNAYRGAAVYYQSALEMAPASSLDRSRLLFKLERARAVAGDAEPELLAAARDALLAAGDDGLAAEAEMVLASVMSDRGDGDSVFECIGRARALVENSEPSPSKAHVISSIAGFLMVAGDTTEAIRLGREALGMAEQFDLDEDRAHALNAIGSSRVFNGDLGGVEDLERSVAIALETSSPTEICRSQLNLGSTFWGLGDLQRGSACWQEAEDTALRFGQIAQTRWIRSMRSDEFYVRGQWEESLIRANELLAEVEAGTPHLMAPVCFATRARIRLGRDDIPGAVADAERALQLAAASKDREALGRVLAAGTDVFREHGDLKRAEALADEFFVEVLSRLGVAYFIDQAHVLAWTLAALSRGQDLIEAFRRANSPWSRAAISFASGDLGAAADVCSTMGAVTEEARDRLWLARALVNQNRRTEANIQLERALVFYRSVGAIRYIRESEELLAATA
jgi:class 3 adenylate cyclase/tetratricopeptide (TPR) repeat protein